MTAQHRVRSVMTTDVAGVGPETPFKAVAVLLEERGVGGAPVVDTGGHVLGVVSRGDLLERKVAHRGFGSRARRNRRKGDAVFAGDLMSRPAITVGADDDIVRAAQLMEDHRVHRLPVVDEHGALAGIVTRADLLRVFLRADNQIRDEVRDEVLEREMCVDPAAFFVSVHQGIVTIDGAVERYSMIPLMEALIRRVDGVVEVRARLAATRDDRHPDPDVPPAGGLFGKRSIHRP
ncbi:CBS domain-containing protein [Amycolatopsis panacis]|uniref:CBS domain-containing protein n=1 Tax=Amycolatopsis panacis TaxID=2340917 RepID=A0A419I6Q6_9PSEU|nr:CBS domain-containing protein [Amycolatopsis panacis]RJQ87255.1 CBS domain-containing protein [Amycolatopsis panacis]